MKYNQVYTVPLAFHYILFIFPKIFYLDFLVFDWYCDFGFYERLSKLKSNAVNDCDFYRRGWDCTLG